MIVIVYITCSVHISFCFFKMNIILNNLNWFIFSCRIQFINSLSWLFMMAYKQQNSFVECSYICILIWSTETASSSSVKWTADRSMSRVAKQVYGVPNRRWLHFGKRASLSMRCVINSDGKYIKLSVLYIWPFCLLYLNITKLVNEPSVFILLKT